MIKTLPMRPLPVKLLFPLFLLMTILVKAQQPTLTVKGPDSAAVLLSRLKTNVKVIGNYSITTMEMEFCNSSGRVLEGELNFPMPEGVSVSRYALDINGKMREAVPVEKEKGQVIFENIERKNVDPGLLEKTSGNNFRTRIYPIPAHGCRRVIIGYEQLLVAKNDYSFLYSLPLHVNHPLKSFDFSITVASNYIPEVGADCNTHLKFEELNQVFTSSVSKKDFAPNGDFSIIIPKTPDAASISMQRGNGQYYFLVNASPMAKTISKPIPGVITVIWDASLSGRNRDHKKEMALLNAYIGTRKNITIHLYSADIDFRKINSYSISNGNWDAMRKDLESISYDGASDFSSIQFPAQGEEYLFFTDGLNSFGNTDNMVLPQRPVNTICAALNADYSFLQLLAAKTGGAFINLNETDSSTAQKQLTEQPLQFLGIRSNGNISDVYPSVPTPVMNNCAIAGIAHASNITAALQFGYGNKVAFEQEIRMDIGLHNTNFINIEKIWAQKKIAELDLQYEKNMEPIRELGQKYSLITRNTSLIVLDRVEDYVQYEIPPPAELLPEYNRLMSEKKREIAFNQRDAIAEATTYFTELKSWWGKEFKIPVTPLAHDKTPTATPTNDPFNRDASVTTNYTASAPVTYNGTMNTAGRVMNNVSYDSLTYSSNARPRNGAVTDTDHDGVNDEEDKCINEPGPASNFGCPVIAENIIQRINYASASPRRGTDKDGLEDDKKTEAPRPASDPVVIEIKEPKPNQSYLKELSATAKQDRYKKYLELRNENDQPTFYFDVAGSFFRDGDTATGYKILSSIADMNLEDHELYKMLGYRLKAIRKYDDELMAFRKVMQWRPQDPQSFRDYALALADAGKYQQALDTLYLALTKNYDEQIKNLYPGIEDVIVTEINGLIAMHGRELNLSKINKALIKDIPVDIRVVLNWNMNDTDIDLWVIEPDGEKCYYSNRFTHIGGRLSHDFTRGYGPEHYMLKKAMKGKYKVIINYYGDTRQRLAGRTTVMAEIYTHYGTASQQRQVVTLQMRGDGSGEVLVGEFSF